MRSANCAARIATLVDEAASERAPAQAQPGARARAAQGGESRAAVRGDLPGAEGVVRARVGHVAALGPAARDPSPADRGPHRVRRIFPQVMFTDSVVGLAPQFSLVPQAVARALHGLRPPAAVSRCDQRHTQRGADPAAAAGSAAGQPQFRQRRREALFAAPRDRLPGAPRRHRVVRDREHRSIARAWCAADSRTFSPAGTTAAI